MFKNLLNFSYKRGWKEAIGFYLAFFLVGFILGGIGGALSGIQSEATTFSQGFSLGYEVGVKIGIVYSLIISCVVLIQRKLYKNFWYFILALLSGLLAFFGGSLLGLIIPAFMTTRGAAVSDTQLT
ncbi:hypothetical protein KGQ34_02220 [Patescibacteria group bacterium]|nr:hypothetical protein [Patescibacteria group bacterium]